MRRAVLFASCVLSFVCVITLGTLMFCRISADMLFKDLCDDNIQDLLIVCEDKDYKLNTEETKQALVLLADLPKRRMLFPAKQNVCTSLNLKLVLKDGSDTLISVCGDCISVNKKCYRPNEEKLDTLLSYCNSIVNEYSDSSPKYPYAHLKVENVSKITEHYGIHSRELNEEQIERLVKRLNELTVYEREDSRIILYGWVAEFRIELTSGDTLTVWATPLHGYVGKKRYRSDYKSSYAITEDYDNYWENYFKKS